MDAKLTLKLDAEVISKAKEYAKENKDSLSRIIENYLKILVSKSASGKKELVISEKVKRMTTMGSIKLPKDFDYKKEMREGKYQDYMDLK